MTNFLYSFVLLYAGFFIMSPELVVGNVVSKQVFTSAGDTATLPCVTSLDSDVDWKYLPRTETSSDASYIYTNGNVYESFRSRFVVSRSDTRRFDLVISDVLVNDSGWYYCIEDSGFGQKHATQLIVNSPGTTVASVGNTDVSETNQWASTGLLFGLLAGALIIIIIVVIAVGLILCRGKMMSCFSESVNKLESAPFSFDEPNKEEPDEPASSKSNALDQNDSVNLNVKDKCELFGGQMKMTDKRAPIESNKKEQSAILTNMSQSDLTELSNDVAPQNDSTVEHSTCESSAMIGQSPPKTIAGSEFKTSTPTCDNRIGNSAYQNEGDRQFPDDSVTSQVNIEECSTNEDAAAHGNTHNFGSPPTAVPGFSTLPIAYKTRTRKDISPVHYPISDSSELSGDTENDTLLPAEDKDMSLEKTDGETVQTDEILVDLTSSSDGATAKL